MRNSLYPQITALFLLAGCCFAHGNALVTEPGPGGYAMSSGNNTLGYDFTTGANPLQVSALGLWDANGDGFAESHPVGLWDASGTLLASVTVPAGTAVPLLNQFRYVDLTTSITLQPETTYVLGAGFIGQDSDQVVFNLNQQATFDPAVSGGNIRSFPNAGFTFPANGFTPGSEVGPNLLFTVPEPSTVALLFVAAACLLGHRVQNSQPRLQTSPSPSKRFGIQH